MQSMHSEEADLSATQTKRPQTEEELNIMAFRPYPPIKHPDDLWKSEFPRSQEYLASLTLEEREKLLRTDFFDYKHAKAREKMIFQEETDIWRDKYEICKRKHQMQAFSACKHIQEILAERTAYSNSKYASSMMPKLSPGLPDLGAKPSKETYNV